ncbi:hypothetical protein GCM10010390_38980 [Streptomyces mordarskii]|uniref:Uncharacterized protein n=1 Tax=Streptomyces mordarskii TaxID=1226758 RepID=A0ABN1D3W6_9ACTN
MEDCAARAQLRNCRVGQSADGALSVSAYIAWKLSAHYQLSTVLRAVLVAATALVVGGGAALISGLVARRGTEDKRVAQRCVSVGAARPR